MNYHVLQKEAVNLCSSQKKKHTKKITKEGKNVVTITQFHDLKPFALLDTKPTFIAFQDEGCMPLHSITHAPYQAISAYISLYMLASKIQCPIF